MYEAEITSLELEWSEEAGFFWQLRQGRFVLADFQRALTKIKSVAIPEDGNVPRRIVSLLWYIPLFMQWQVERVRENQGDSIAFTGAITTITNEIERLLGVP